MDHRMAHLAWQPPHRHANRKRVFITAYWPYDLCYEKLLYGFENRASFQLELLQKQGWSVLRRKKLFVH